MRRASTRFRARGFLSPAGRTRTAPQPDSLVAQLRICAVSCADYEDGWFTTYRAVAEEQPDLVVELGDFIMRTALVGGALPQCAGTPGRIRR